MFALTFAQTHTHSHQYGAGHLPTQEIHKSTKGPVTIRYTISTARCAHAVNLIQHIAFCQIYDLKKKKTEKSFFLLNLTAKMLMARTNAVWCVRRF